MTQSPVARPSPQLFSGVPGQEEALGALARASASPVHAYLLAGPPGSGAAIAARGFAAALLCPEGGCGCCVHCRQALLGAHPDLAIVERRGATLRVDDAREATRLAQRAPREARRVVVVVPELHLIERAGPALLKTLEEPPPSTVFVLVTESLGRDLATLASRCVVVRFAAPTPDAVVSVLESEGVAPAAARDAVLSAGGRLDRARALVRDEGAMARRAVWMGAPARLDGSGATVAIVAEELLATIDAASAPLRSAQAEEMASLEAAARAVGEARPAQRAETEDAHRRALRRARADALREGLAALASHYRARLATDAATGIAVGLVEDCGRALVQNPNEALLIQALLVRLSQPELMRSRSGLH